MPYTSKFWFIWNETSTWPKGLSCTSQEPYCLLSLTLLPLMRISRDKMPKASEENMYLISKGIRAAWSSQIYRGYALLTENRVKRWIIDPYRIIHRPRTVMATKTERSFTFYLKFIPLVCPSSELPEIFFFSFSIFQPFRIISWRLLSINPFSLPSQVMKSLWVEPMTCTLKMLMEEAADRFGTKLKPGLGNWGFVFVLHNKWST